MGLGSSRHTVLVTGAAGFVGSHLVDRFLSEGYDVLGLDNLMTGDLENLAAAGKDPHFHLEIGDVRESLHVYADLVMNLACPASPNHYQSDPHATLTTSVLGALRLVEHARGRKCRVVQASTSEVYGDPAEHPQTETYWGHVNPIGTRACYDEGKRVAETILMDAVRIYKLDARIIRIFNTYGPRMAFNDGRVVSNFIIQALHAKSMTLYGSGQQTRSFCYVSDLVEGLFRAATVPTFDSPMNLGNPKEFTIKELGEIVCEQVGVPFEPEMRELPADDPTRRCPDITKARKELGFEPKIQLREGIKNTVIDFKARLGRSSASPASRRDLELGKTR
jgi:UDP-glucuronate decarboxylase